MLARIITVAIFILSTTPAFGQSVVDMTGTWKITYKKADGTEYGTRLIEITKQRGLKFWGTYGRGTEVADETFSGQLTISSTVTLVSMITTTGTQKAPRIALMLGYVQKANEIVGASVPANPTLFTFIMKKQ